MRPANQFVLLLNTITTSNITATEKCKTELKRKFPEDFFQKVLGCVQKQRRNLILKKMQQQYFDRKGVEPFAALDPINKESERLENLRVISKIDNSEWATPTVYTKKKNNTIHVCADFSTGLNDNLKNYNHPLPTPEEIFAKLNDGKY